MADFDSLTKALDDWFDEPFQSLPDPLRPRVEKEFVLIPWDTLSPEQRRSVAMTLDYQRDPATESERQFWWDFFHRRDELKSQIAQWVQAAATTVTELATREERLKQLQDELARMEATSHRARGDHLQRRVPTTSRMAATSPSSDSPIDSSSVMPIDYVAFPKAMAELISRHGATPEELAAWVLMGPSDGGLAAYLNANELDPPRRFHFGDGFGGAIVGHDFLAPLMACSFRANDLEAFSPKDRYITGKALIKRWSSQPGLRPLVYLRAKIHASQLMEFHPVCGATQAAYPEDISLPAPEAGLFLLSQVEAIEAAEFGASRGSASGQSAPQPNIHQTSVEGTATPTVPTAQSTRPPRMDVGRLAGRTRRPLAEPMSATVDRAPSDNRQGDPEVGSAEWRKCQARAAAEARHGKPGGSRDRRRLIREMWASGKYSSRSVCAEQECEGLRMAYSTALKALKNTPEPIRG